MRGDIQCILRTRFTDAKWQRWNGDGLTTGAAFGKKSARGKVRRRQHFVHRAQRRNNQIVFKRNRFKLGLGARGEPGLDQRIDFVRILRAHRTQVLITRLGSPFRVAHHGD